MLAAVCGWGLTFCEGAPTETHRVVKTVQQSADGVVVARVNGETITLSEVEELSRAANLAPAQALARLEEERLLAAYAEQQGYGQDAQAAREIKRARVRALLKTAVEQGSAPEDVPQAEVQARFETVRQRDERPEQRLVMYVLFKTDSTANETKARTEAEALFKSVNSKVGVEGKLAALESLPDKGDYRGVPVLRETLDTRKDALEVPLGEATFSLGEAGLVPRVVRASKGFYVLLVRDMKPAFRLVLAEQEGAIRAQLSSEKRQAALSKVIEELKLKEVPKLDETFVRKALADDRLLGAAP